MSNHAVPAAASNDSKVLKKTPSQSNAGQDEATARVVAASEEPRGGSDDDELAERMGHKSEFSREFKSMSTISFAFSIMYVLFLLHHASHNNRTNILTWHVV